MGLHKNRYIVKMMQWCILVLGKSVVIGHSHAGSVGQGLQLGLLVHSEQIVNGGGRHWISSLCTVLTFEHQGVISTVLV